MPLRKQEVIAILRRAGFPEVADEASRVLPHEIELDELAEWAAQHGITRDALISRMGGSP